MRKSLSFLFFITIVMIAGAGISAVFFSGCFRSSKPSFPEESQAVTDNTTPVWPNIAVIKTGEHPLWFEFSGQGPKLIDSPARASLVDYAPWPHSRFCAGMLGSGGDLVLAVNRDGFLIVNSGKESGSASLYRSAAPEYWDPFTIASVFVYNEMPAALLYRDDFFVHAEVPAPEYPVMVLRENQRQPAGIHVPAFGMLPKEAGWEVNALRRGPDSIWYYRFVQTAYSQPETVYYSTPDLSLEGERTSLALFRNASMPEPVSNAPSCAVPLINAIAGLFSGLPQIPIIRMISSELNSPESFSPISSAAPVTVEDFFPLFGYYIKETLAFAIMPDGYGIASVNNGIVYFSLPSLPEGFVYTGAGLAGNILIASWEEQQDSAVGAAGFMALNAETSGLFGSFRF